MSPSEFQRFIDTFGPFDMILKNCHRFVLSGGFERISAATAISELSSAPPGTYIVRPSDTVFAYTISYKTKANEVKHRRVGNPLWNGTLLKGTDVEQEYKSSKGVRTISDAPGEYPFCVNILAYIEHYKADFSRPLRPPQYEPDQDGNYE